MACLTGILTTHMKETHNSSLNKLYCFPFFKAAAPVINIANRHDLSNKAHCEFFLSNVKNGILLIVCHTLQIV